MGAAATKLLSDSVLIYWAETWKWGFCDLDVQGNPSAMGMQQGEAAWLLPKSGCGEYVSNTFMAIFANKETLDMLWPSKDSSVAARLGKDWQISAKKWGCLGLARPYDLFLFFWLWSFNLWIRENYSAAGEGEQS